jgi:hypothetical protein
MMVQIFFFVLQKKLCGTCQHLDIGYDFISGHLNPVISILPHHETLFCDISIIISKALLVDDHAGSCVKHLNLKP